MELAIPLVALGSLYIVSNQTKKPKPAEGFLPNTNIPDKNYPYHTLIHIQKIASLIKPSMPTQINTNLLVETM